MSELHGPLTDEERAAFMAASPHFAEVNDRFDDPINVGIWIKLHNGRPHGAKQRGRFASADDRSKFLCVAASKLAFLASMKHAEPWPPVPAPSDPDQTQPDPSLTR